jgi:hypothetical protein
MRVYTCTVIRLGKLRLLRYTFLPQNVPVGAEYLYSARCPTFSNTSDIACCMKLLIWYFDKSGAVLEHIFPKIKLMRCL